MTTHRTMLPSCLKERVISLMNDWEEEDFYRENFDDVPDDVLELKDIPTDVLEPSHYKILRQMIDFIDSYLPNLELEANIVVKKLKDENDKWRARAEESMEMNLGMMEHMKEIKAENKDLKAENKDLKENVPKMKELILDLMKDNKKLTELTEILPKMKEEIIKLRKENHDLRNIPPEEFKQMVEKNFDFEKLALEVNDGLLEENKKLKEENKKQKTKLDRYQKMFIGVFLLVSCALKYGVTHKIKKTRKIYKKKIKN